MQLYLAAGRYVGTQAEAKKLDRAFKPVTVPTDKEGLIAYLNGLAGKADTLRTGEGMAAKGVRTMDAPVQRQLDMTATAVLSRSDNPGIDVDGIVETIGAASGYALRRYAGAVAVAFQSLSE